MSFRWRVPPDHLIRNLQAYERRAMGALDAFAADNAQRLQDEARQNAPWEDRTGNARSGLMGSSGREGRFILIVLAHTVFYGKFLELRWGGRYAIILPTIWRNLNAIRNQLVTLFRG